MTAERSIDYDALTQDALRGVVRTILTQVGKTGLPGDHHFYIAFDTQAPGVVLSRRLKEKYPEEMTIVLQHRFWDLLVADDNFEVKLTFDGIPERLVVPFASLRVFFDPSVRFTLQFGETGPDEAQDGAGQRRRRRDNSNTEADAGGNGNAQRSAADRRPRPRPKSRSAGAADTDALPPTTEVAPRIGPALVARGGEAVVKPAALAPPMHAPAPVAAAPPSPASTSTDGTAGAPAAGAKVFSLDQFRKK